MSDLSSVSAAAFLVADPTRAAMLMVLLDGRALPAGELARAAGVTAQTASSHLSRLLEGGLVEVEAEGRHRYYRLAGSHVAQALEQLAAIRPAKPAGAARPKALSPEQRQLRWCRSCYDHLAGQVGVAVTRALRERDYLRAAADKRFAVTAAGVEWFGRIGVDIASIEPTPRGLARPCLDWTERFHHLGGPLGVRLLETLCAHGWLRRSRTPRVLTVTPKGWAEFGRTLGLTEESVRQSQG